MKFLEKNAAYIRLKKVDALEADRALLKLKNPKAKVLTDKFFGRPREGNEILNALLDVATVEEIEASRNGELPEPGPEITGSGSGKKLPPADDKLKTGPGTAKKKAGKKKKNTRR
jgi:hypothetical protein